MPESILEAPATENRWGKRNKHTFTPELAKKALEARRHKLRERKRLAAIGEALGIGIATANNGETAANGAEVKNEELEIVQEQITRTRAQLREGMAPGERAQLVRALDLMLDRKRILQERPLPGSRRPAPEPRQQRRSSLLAPPSSHTPPASESQAG